jgi:hypothetical protein
MFRVVAIVAGAILGGLLGFFGLFWRCILVDRIEGNGPGEGSHA